MATYKSIKGFRVQTLASDPVTAGVASATWSAGGNLATGNNGMGNAGTQTAG